MTRNWIIGLLCALGLSLAAPSVQAEPAFFARAPVQAWHGQHFTIIQISSLNRFDALRAMLENWVDSYPDEVEALQGAIRANGPLAAALRSRGVQIRNIAAIQQSFSGNLIFYLR